MKSFTLFLTLIMTVTLAQATIRRVAKDGSGDFTTIQAAINASPAGDTVVVMGDLGPYGETLTISSRLVLIGQGTGCGNVPSSQVNRVIFGGGSDQSILEGFYVSQGTYNWHAVLIQTGALGITLRRCGLYASTNTDQEALLLENNTSANVQSCWLDGDNPCIGVGSASSLSVSNCIISNSGSGVSGDNMATSISITNCAFVGNGAPFVSQAQWRIENCVFWDCSQINGSGLGNVIASYNAFNSTPLNFPYVTGPDTTILQDPFVTYDEAANYASCTSDLHLSPASGLVNRGDPDAASDRDGSRRDLGAYGGPNPFVDTGAPDFPFVTQFFVPVTVPQNGVLEIRSTGRVGQGVGQ